MSPGTDPFLGPFAAWRDRHAGEAIVVCGCGRSLGEFAAPERFVTIGVNDVGRAFDPTYLVVVNGEGQFTPGRYRHVAESRARAVFTHLDSVDHPRAVRFRLGRRGRAELDDPRTLDYSNNSPYVAVGLAVHMGARLIGLIGVDFTPHHFFERTGTHHLAARLTEIDRDYGRLAAACRGRGVRLVNLSHRSKLRSLPFKSLGAFEELASARRHDGSKRVRYFAPAYRVRSKVSGARRETGAVGRPSRRRRPRSPRPLRTLAEPPVRVAVERRDGRIGAFLDGLARSAARAGCRVSRSMHEARRRPSVVSIVWNGRHHRGPGPTVYCEHGWLPRSAFQVSPLGINADSHLAGFAWDGGGPDDAARRRLEMRLNALRQEGLTAAPLSRVSHPDHFILVPLQLERDTNIVRHAPPGLRTMQDLVDAVSAADPPLPILFKEHPASARSRAGGQTSPQPDLRRPEDLLWRHQDGGVHQLLAGGGCRGVVSINSNVLHDALLWDVPGIALGRGVWSHGTPGLFLGGMPAPGEWPTSLGRARPPAGFRLAYLDHLIEGQWTMEDAREVTRVRALLDATRGAQSSAFA